MPHVQIIHEGVSFGPLRTTLTLSKLVQIINIDPELQPLLLKLDNVAPIDSHIGITSATNAMDEVALQRRRSAVGELLFQHRRGIEGDDVAFGIRGKGGIKITTIRDMNANIPSGVYELVCMKELEKEFFGENANVLSEGRDTILADNDRWDKRVDVIKRSRDDMRTSLDDVGQANNHAQQRKQSTMTRARSKSIESYSQPTRQNNGLGATAAPSVRLSTMSGVNSSTLLTNNTGNSSSNQQQQPGKVVPTVDDIEAAITDILEIISSFSEHPPHLPTQPSLENALKDLSTLTELLDEIRPKKKGGWRAKIEEAVLDVIPDSSLTHLNVPGSRVGSKASLARGKSAPGQRKVNGGSNISVNVPALPKKENAVTKTDQEATDAELVKPQTAISTTSMNTFSSRPTTNSPEYTLILYHTLHTVMTLFRSLTNCPRSGMQYYHISDVMSFEKLRQAEWVLSSYHVWRKILRLDKTIEKRKAPLMSYRVQPTFLFRRMLSVSPAPPKTLGLLTNAEVENQTKTKMPMDKEVLYKEFKKDFMEAWTHCRVFNDHELVVLLDIMIEERKAKLKCKHGCFQKWVYPASYVKERIMMDFEICLGRKRMTVNVQQPVKAIDNVVA